MTGAGGFIGGYLARKLRLEYASAKIIFVSNHASLEKDARIGYDSQTGWIDAGDSSIECDILIHAGSFTPKRSDMANDVVGSTSNINFTVNLLHKLNLNRLNKIIFLSTLDVYGRANLINEDTDTTPSTLYGLSKLYSEKIIEEFCKERTVNFLIVRVGHVFGAGEHNYQKLIPTCMKKVLQDEPIVIYGKGEDLRCFIHVDDVAEGIIVACKDEYNFNVVNAVSSSAFSINQIVQKIIGLNGSAGDVQYVERTTPRKDYLFDDKRFLSYFLREHRDFDIALKEEFDFMRSLL